MDIIKFFYDVETTGVKVNRHSIHQIAGVIEVNDEVVETIDIKTRPNPKAEILDEAMDKGGVTKEQILAYPPMEEMYKKLLKILGKYVDRYNPREKIYLVGFNNRNFDDGFLRAWFEQNGDNYFNSWFWPNSLDALVQATEYLLDRRVNMPNFQLKTVAKQLGLAVEEDRLHEGGYDVELTRSIYRIVTERELEI